MKQEVLFSLSPPLRVFAAFFFGKQLVVYSTTLHYFHSLLSYKSLCNAKQFMKENVRLNLLLLYDWENYFYVIGWEQG